MIVTAEILLLALLIGGVVLALIALIALLTLARQFRAWRQYRAAIYTPSAAVLAQAVDHAISPGTMTARPNQPRRMVAGADVVALPMREGRSDQVVIDIHPPDGPTRDQQNIQRLIDYLKAQTLTDESLTA